MILESYRTDGPIPTVRVIFDGPGSRTDAARHVRQYTRTIGLHGSRVTSRARFLYRATATQTTDQRTVYVYQLIPR